MRLYLHAYQVNGQTLGTELDTWSGDQLNNNSSFITSTYSIVSGYSNITSIENWHRFGEEVISSYQDKQRAIKLSFYDKGWDNCSNNEKSG